MNPPPSAPEKSRELRALAKAFNESWSGNVNDELELAEELRDELGVYIAQMREIRKRWVAEINRML